MHRRARHGPGLRGAVTVVGSVAAGVTVVPAAAVVSARPAILLAAGLFGAAAVCVAGCYWVARASAGRHGRAVRTTAVASALAVAGTAVALGVPSGDVNRPADPVAGEERWSLPTGSRLRVVEIGARGRTSRTPVVFLHGGPGTPDLARDARFLGRLADNGFTVYVYDQIGAGGSDRLADPEAYSRDRDVADLEAIRRRIGAAQMVLVGHSYGAQVVAAYLAAHPGRVASVVLLSPASLDPADASGGNLTSRLDTPDRATVYARILRPRNLLVYTLLQVDVEAAHSLAGDREMDAQSDLVYATGEPALHCDGRQALAHPPTGTGFYRLYYPQSANAPPEPDLRPLLDGDDTPTLLVKGTCDYLSWASAVTYLTTLRDARLVYLRAGHNVHHDAADQVLAVLRDFLTGRPLSVPARSGTAVPPDYQGPP